MLHSVITMVHQSWHKMMLHSGITMLSVWMQHDAAQYYNNVINVDAA